MKKRLLVRILCLLAVCLTAPALTGAADSRTIDVHAKYVSALPWNTAVPDENGRAETTLPDGTEVIVNGIADSRWTLIVDIITDKEVLHYLDGATETGVSARLPLHVFFLDETGAVRSADGVTIAVQSAQKLSHPVAYALSEGALKGLPVSADGSSLRFTANASNVYVLGSIQKDVPSPPKTGDTSYVVLWLALLFISAGCLCVTGTLGARKRSSAK